VFGTDASARIFAASTFADPDALRHVAAGERFRARLHVENRLRPGRFHVGCSLLAGSAGKDVVLLQNRATSFVSYGGERVYGLAAFDHELTFERERPA
jgi:hypothetical protein